MPDHAIVAGRDKPVFSRVTVRGSLFVLFRLKFVVWSTAIKQSLRDFLAYISTLSYSYESAFASYISYFLCNSLSVFFLKHFLFIIIALVRRYSVPRSDPFFEPFHVFVLDSVSSDVFVISH